MLPKLVWSHRPSSFLVTLLFSPGQLPIVPLKQPEPSILSYHTLWIHSYRNLKLKSVGVAQEVKGLLCSHEDRNSISRTHGYDPSAEEVETGRSLGLLEAPD